MIDLALYSLEKSLNHYLALDPNSAEKLHALEGKILKLVIKPIEIFFSFENQFIKINSQPEKNIITATLEGYPLAFLQLPFLDKAQIPKLFKQELKISGDLEFGQHVRDLFQNIDIDWEEQISSMTGDIIAHELSQCFQYSKKFANKLTHSIQRNVTEYLQEESKDLPCREEVEDFCDDIDHLKLRVDRLDATLKESL